MSEEDRRKQDVIQDTSSLLDVVEEEFPEKVRGLFGGLSQIGNLLTVEDWLKILTRSRSSLEDAWKDKK
ncbi:MAG: hypothetical protein FWH49_05370 [Clostridiales bacterium]|nr:hypothetical protein [Clostridiales bacterium]